MKFWLFILLTFSYSAYATAQAPAKKFMVAAANPDAVETGIKILQAGGNALDAAIAVQMMLTLVEPQSSGIGGGAFLLYWDNQQKKLFAYDGRETAPQQATFHLFLDKKDKPLEKWQAIVGGRSVGVPGVLKMLELAHQQHGKLTWSSLFQDSIRLAEQGFKVAPQLAQDIVKQANPGLIHSASAYEYFYPKGIPLQQGQLVINKALAATFRKIAQFGTKAFYEGELAAAMVKTVKNNSNPGLLELADLKNYRAKQRDSLCIVYGQYKVCSIGPPSSGGIAVMQILSLLKNYSLADYDLLSIEAVHLFTQASRLAYADRDYYLADPDFVRVPVEALLAPSYLTQRAGLINADKDAGKVEPGLLISVPRQDSKKDWIPAFAGTTVSLEQPSTSHISIVDAQGNAVSMTTSIEVEFGSTLMAGGFLLNNQLTDFSFNPKSGEQWIANRIEGGKRPRSSMAPIMVFDQNDKLVLVVGSPGGSRIISYVAQTLLAVLEWNMDIQSAISLPHTVNRNDRTELEANTSLVALQPLLQQRGHKTEIRALKSGLHAIQITATGLLGAADPRRDGVAKGE